MKKFRERSNRGQRNLILLYSISGLAAIFLFLILNQFLGDEMPSADGIYSDNTVPAAQPTPAKAVPDISEANATNKDRTLPPDTIPICKDASDFVFSMLSLVGTPIANEGSSHKENSLERHEFLMYGLQQLGSSFTLADFNEIPYEELQIGDIGICGEEYGFYLGTFDEKPTFITASSIGNIFSAEEPTVSLCYASAYHDELLNGWFPMDFSSYYHFNKHSFEEELTLDLTESEYMMPESKKSYADRVYEINQLFRNADFAGSATLLHTSVTEKEGYYLNTDKYAAYFINLVSNMEAAVNGGDIKDAFLSISSLYPTTNGCIVGIKAYFPSENGLTLASSFDYTLYADGTYLPYNVFTEKNCSSYGFTYLADGESLATEENNPGGINSSSGCLIQTEDGRWILRGGGFDQDITDLVNEGKLDVDVFGVEIEE